MELDENGNPVTKPPEKPPEKPPVVFTQEQVNEFLAKEKKKAKDEVEKLKAAAGDKAALENKLNELTKSYSTKEELAAEAARLKAEEYENEKKGLLSEKDIWRDRYVSQSVKTAITDAAVKHNAFDAQQLERLIGPDTRLKEETDKDGKGTGKFVSITTIVVGDKTLELPTDEAVGKLREVNKYPNQFRANGQGGTGTFTMNNVPDDAGAGGEPTTVEGMMKKYAGKR